MKQTQLCKFSAESLLKGKREFSTTNDSSLIQNASLAQIRHSNANLIEDDFFISVPSDAPLTQKKGRLDAFSFNNSYEEDPKDKAIVRYNSRDKQFSIFFNLKDSSLGLRKMLGSDLFSLVPRFNGKPELIHLRCFTTSIPKETLNNCLPVPLPPKSLKCVVPRDLRDCKIPTHPKWEGCDKICMPCCCPAVEHCEDLLPPKLNTCKKLEYRLPSFAECKKAKLPRQCLKECCYPKYICPYESVGSSIKPLIRTEVRQAWLLGRRTSVDHLKHFSTMPALYREDKDCKKQGKLPCLRASEILGSAKVKLTGTKACDKLCMPCCAPARDPPECFYPYVKPECTRLRPPRPSYSECKKDIIKSIKPCECLIPRPPLCDKLAKDKGAKGCGNKSDSDS